MTPKSEPRAERQVADKAPERPATSGAGNGSPAKSDDKAQQAPASSPEKPEGRLLPWEPATPPVAKPTEAPLVSPKPVTGSTSKPSEESAGDS